MITREFFDRIVIWQPRSGFAIDLTPRQLRSLTSGRTNTGFDSGTGRVKELSRQHTFSCGSINGDVAEHLYQMRDQRCPVRAVALNRAGRHILFYEAANLIISPVRPGVPSDFTQEQVVLVQNVFDAAVFHGVDLLDGIPWECTRPQSVALDCPVQYRSGASTGGSGSGSGSGGSASPLWIVQSGEPGYRGPFWEAIEGPIGSGSGSGSVGLLSGIGTDGILTDGAAELVMELPIGGATVQYRTTGGQVECLDFFGNVLTTAVPYQAFVVPYLTWFMRFTVTEAIRRPELIFLHFGITLPPRLGACFFCESQTSECTRAGTLPENEEPPGFPEEPFSDDVLQSSVICCPAALDPQDNAHIIYGEDDNSAPFLTSLADIVLDGAEDEDGVVRFSKRILDVDGDNIYNVSLQFTAIETRANPAGSIQAGTYSYEVHPQITLAGGQSAVDIDFDVLRELAIPGVRVTLGFTDGFNGDIETFFEIFETTADVIGGPVDTVPQGYSGLLVDFDSNQNVWSNAAKTNPASSNENVAAWDAIFGGVETTQPNSTKRPIYRINGPNGHNTIDFEGNDEHFSISNIVAVSAFTCIVVSNIEAADFQVILGADTAAGANRLALGVDASGDLLFRTDSTDLTFTVSLSGYHVYAFRYGALSATSRELFQDSETALADDTGAFTTGDIAVTAIGAQYNAGPVDANHLDGKIARLLFYDEALSDVDLGALIDHLQTLYGLA